MAWTDARRILAVRLDTLGDVLMTTPALRALKEGCPGGHVTLLTSSAGAAVRTFSIRSVSRDLPPSHGSAPEFAQRSRGSLTEAPPRTSGRKGMYAARGAAAALVSAAPNSARSDTTSIPVKAAASGPGVSTGPSERSFRSLRGGRYRVALRVVPSSLR